MITIVNGFFDIFVSTLSVDFIVFPVLSAVIASIAFVIFGIIKGRG